MTTRVYFWVVIDVLYGSSNIFAPDYPYWRDKKSFNGKDENIAAPTPLLGEEVLENYVNSIIFFEWEKNSDGPWKEISIYFKLLYRWQNRLWHNLDLIQIAKNFCDSSLVTLLDIEGKSKDHVNSCYELHEMGIHKEVQLTKNDNNGKVY